MSHLVLIKNNEPVASSYVISEQTDNQHKAVIQLIRQNLEELQNFGRVEFQMEAFATNGGNQNREIALLNERQATLLISFMRNSDVVKKFKVSLVKAFYEMAEHIKQQQQFCLPQTFSEALRLLADAEEVKAIQAKQIEEQKPLVDFANRIANSEGALKIGDFAKIISSEGHFIIGQNRLFAKLREWNVLQSDNVPYQKFIDNGYFSVVEGSFTSSSGAKVWKTTKINPKGQLAVFKKLNKEMNEG